MVDANVSAALVLSSLNGNNLFVKNVAGPLWNRIVANEHPLQYEDRWKAKANRLWKTSIYAIKSTYTIVLYNGSTSKTVQTICTPISHQIIRPPENIGSSSRNA